VGEMLKLVFKKGIMKKTIFLLLALIISGYIHAQYGYKIKPDSMQTIEKSASYYLKKAGSNLQWSVGFGLISSGFGIGSAFVAKDQRSVFWVGAGLASLGSFIAYISSGSNLKKAGKALEKRKQKKVSLQGTQNGVGLVFRF
jgi:hypothetical protein